MNVRICATAASPSHVHVLRGVCSWFFDAIASATMSGTNAINIKGASRAVVTENSVRAGNAKILSACRHSLPEKRIEGTIQ
jgi:hypothetical protein